MMGESGYAKKNRSKRGEAGVAMLSVVNERFFNPFCCKNKEVYFACINELLEKSKQLAVLYETDARSTLILYLQNSQISLETEDIGDEISNKRTPQENAAAILRYFRQCGWLVQQEIGRSGDNLATVTPYCRKLVEALNKIFTSDANGAITNHIFSMYEILKAAMEKDSARAIRPYTNVLLPLLENAADLKNELYVLKDSIREIMRAVLQMNDANSFGQFLIKDELLHKFFTDYFFIKKSGLIPSYIANIDKMLRKLKRSDLYEKILLEFLDLKQVSLPEAKGIIERQFESLDVFLNAEYEKEMDYIDRKINTYYNLYSVRVMMVLSNNTNLEHILNRLLLLLKDMDEEDRGLVLMQLAQAHQLLSINYLSRKSFARRKKQQPNLHNTALTERKLSKEELEQLTADLLSAEPERYSLDNVAAYFAAKLQDKEWLGVEECGVHTRDDAMMLAASIIYSGSAGFPFVVEFEEGLVQTDVAAISKIKVRRLEQ